MQPSLIVAEGRQEGKRVVLAGFPFLIGRDPSCQLRPVSDDVAPRHCALVERDGRLFIRDLGSDAGTFVNYERIAGEVRLDEGDRIQVGPLAFIVTLSAAGPPPAAVAAAVAPAAARPTPGDASSSSRFDSTELMPLDSKDLAELPAAAPHHFLIREAAEGDVTVATFTDEKIIDEVAIREVKAELSRLIAEGRLKVLLDFQNVKYMSSSALGVLMGFYKELRAAGGRVRICALNANVADVFRMMNLEKIISIFPDEEAAMLRRW